ncbi:MAG: imidazole glycerol phosphate synthase subunit HisF [Variovorax sp.]|nr:imidazole glycerol phosphate synthase subunit HisF [Variovorax sp.]
MRAIARLDIKNEWVIKGIQLEGLRKVGNPIEMAEQYYLGGINEIVFMDAVASLYDRNNLFHIIERACRKVFVPIAIGGGLRSLEDVSRALDCGADKVVINTGAVRNIGLVTEIANRFGSQCVIGSIEAKRDGFDKWNVYVDNGREPTGFDVLTWVKRLEQAGVGEILLTSVDQEGTGKGFDNNLVEAVNKSVNRPVIVSGGYGEPKHVEALLKKTTPSAVAFASVLHYRKSTPFDLMKIISDAKLACESGK